MLGSVGVLEEGEEAVTAEDESVAGDDPEGADFLSEALESDGDDGTLADQTL